MKTTFTTLFVVLVSVGVFCQNPEEDLNESEELKLEDLAHLPETNQSFAFSCEDHMYGYYADVESACKYFHVCHPVADNSGDEHITQLTFLCPNQTVFSQKVISCVELADSIPCSMSGDFFNVNEELLLADHASSEQDD